MACVITNDGQMIYNLNGFLDLVNKQFGIDRLDFAALMEEYTIKPQEHPELQKMYDDIIEDNKSYTDGLLGDDFYIAGDELRNAQEEIRAEIDNLRSNSRKNNTKADIAKRLENIVANMDYIL